MREARSTVHKAPHSAALCPTQRCSVGQNGCAPTGAGALAGARRFAAQMRNCATAATGAACQRSQTDACRMLSIALGPPTPLRISATRQAPAAHRRRRALAGRLRREADVISRGTPNRVNLRFGGHSWCPHTEGFRTAGAWPPPQPRDQLACPRRAAGVQGAPA